MGESTNGLPPRLEKPLSRRFPRYRVDVRVLVKVRREQGIDLLRGRSTDISEGGMGVTLAGELEAGDLVDMEFSLPFSRHPLHLHALVRHRDGLHYGLEFRTLSAQQRESIRRLCEPLSTLD